MPRTTPVPDDDFLSELRQLRAGFTEALPARLDEVHTAVIAAVGDATARDHAATLAHRLRGSAGTYGHPEVGVLMGRVEEALADPGVPIEDCLAITEVAAREARDLVRHAGPEART